MSRDYWAIHSDASLRHWVSTLSARVVDDTASAAQQAHARRLVEQMTAELNLRAMEKTA